MLRTFCCRVRSPRRRSAASTFRRARAGNALVTVLLAMAALGTATFAFTLYLALSLRVIQARNTLTRTASAADGVVRVLAERAVTLSELAAYITSTLHLDPPLALKVVSEDEYVASNAGGEELLRKWATTFPALKRGELATVDPLLQTILGRPLKPFEETVKETYEGTDGGAAAVQQYSRLRK